ncbi:inner membrane protein yohK [Ketogulonicigenium robustum]|uniref:Inner membrane protein yohK n=1 Tax=Ketogulonicigenium robustum TaxID=92947 RepID=A0A1W6P0R3_9RHOB|nr:LrgB family protein [Ketogulonicigenium robustum]ARO14920.1 inner membrane protein yohK [Ketogulonicigenium robustum]
MIADLLHSPILWLTLTVGVFAGAQMLARLSGNHPVVNPVLISIAVVVVTLVATGTDYATYMSGAQLIYLLLGPATVAIALSLFRARHLIRERALPVIGALVVGAPVGATAGWLIARGLGADQALALALVPKSVTAGIAVGVADAIGALAPLTVAVAISTGVVGAVIAGPLLNLLGIRDPAARGFAMGVSAHGIATARAMQVSAVSGAFAGLGMALNGVVTAIVIPLAFAAFGQ